MDYQSGIILVVSILVTGTIALVYSLKKNAGNFFSGEGFYGKEIEQSLQRQRGLKILKKRLENGEITQEEYDELKKQFDESSNPET